MKYVKRNSHFSYKRISSLRMFAIIFVNSVYSLCKWHQIIYVKEKNKNKNFENQRKFKICTRNGKQNPTNYVSGIWNSIAFHSHTVTTTTQNYIKGERIERSLMSSQFSLFDFVWHVKNISLKDFEVLFWLNAWRVSFNFSSFLVYLFII